MTSDESLRFPLMPYRHYDEDGDLVFERTDVFDGVEEGDDE